MPTDQVEEFLVDSVAPERERAAKDGAVELVAVHNKKTAAVCRRVDDLVFHDNAKAPGEPPALFLWQGADRLVVVAGCVDNTRARGLLAA